MNKSLEQINEETELHLAVRQMSEQLRRSINGEQPVPIQVVTSNADVQGLAALINNVLGNAQNAVERLETLNRNLDQNIRERTAELEYARSIAESGSNAKSNFLAQMSHELRTPLNAILGFAQLLVDSRKETLSDRQNKQIGHILQSGQHLLGLINDVLDLTKVESGRMDLQIEAVDPAAIISESLEMISPLIDNYNIQFENRIVADNGLPHVKCDPLRVKQCLINLLNNAFKYNNPDGLVWISVRVFENERLRFIVGDTGIGIPINKQHELFRPFSRLGREDSEIEGSGIGLALTRLLVDSMDGTLDYISIEGQGSQFWFDLPIAPQPEVLPLGNDEYAVSDKTRPQGVILYIEDVSSNVMLMHDILAEYTDVQLLTANSGETGIRIAKEQLPDLIIMDINLTGMNGVDAIRYIRSVSSIKNIPVFVLTGDAREETRRRCEQVGVDMFFAKPVDVASFINAVGRCLDQKLGKLL